jgi:hypothetical protein
VPATLFAATGIFVAPGGNDANPGTQAQPVATPQGAQVWVRALIQAGLSNAVEVIFAAGTYSMTAPLELRPQDSGTPAFPITWKAATNATVVLSGGKRITGTWTNGGGGIWFTDLAGVGLAPDEVHRHARIIDHDELDLRDRSHTRGRLVTRPDETGMLLLKHLPKVLDRRWPEPRFFPVLRGCGGRKKADQTEDRDEGGKEETQLHGDILPRAETGSSGVCRARATFPESPPPQVRPAPGGRAG